MIVQLGALLATAAPFADHRPDLATGTVDGAVRIAWVGWRFVSRGDGDRCRFAPTCSAFAVQVMRRDGLPGAVAVFDRLVREADHRSYPRGPDHHHLDPVHDHAPAVDLLLGRRCRRQRRSGYRACF